MGTRWLRLGPVEEADHWIDSKVMEERLRGAQDDPELGPLHDRLQPDTVQTKRSIATAAQLMRTKRVAGAVPWRSVLGPWRWMVLLYRYEESSDRVYVVAVHDARSATSATVERS